MKAEYTHRQMVDMMQVTRSWTLNNPAGDLPFLPTMWRDDVPVNANIEANAKTMPPYKKTHWLIKLIWNVV